MTGGMTLGRISRTMMRQVAGARGCGRRGRTPARGNDGVGPDQAGDGGMATMPMASTMLGTLWSSRKVDDGEGQQQRREREQHVHDAHQAGLGPLAEVAGRRGRSSPPMHSPSTIEAKPDGQGHPSAPDGRAEHVASEVVGAEPVGGSADRAAGVSAPTGPVGLVELGTRSGRTSSASRTTSDEPPGGDPEADAQLLLDVGVLARDLIGVPAEVLEHRDVARRRWSPISVARSR